MDTEEAGHKLRKESGVGVLFQRNDNVGELLSHDFGADGSVAAYLMQSSARQ